MTTIRGPRSGYQCLPGNDDCPGHPSKWDICDPATEQPHHAAARTRTDDERARIDWLAPLAPKTDPAVQALGERTAWRLGGDAAGPGVASTPTKAGSRADGPLRAFSGAAELEPQGAVKGSEAVPGRPNPPGPVLGDPDGASTAHRTART